MGKIAILAFGSLVWSPRNLKIKSDWQYGGPAIPVEFSRIAKNGRLVLTYTPGVEALPTYYAESAFTDPEQAIANLASREGCHIRHISTFKSDNPEFKNWLQAHGFDHALHCALPVNFKELRGEEFSGPAAQRYLDTLNEEQFALAWEYIVNAPPEIMPPVRRYLLENYKAK